MLRIHASLTTLTAVARHRLRARRHDEEGLTTLEWVVLALGLFLLATGAVAVIKLAVDKRINQIT